MEDLQKRLTLVQESSDTRCQDSVASHQQKIKQLEDDIASMIRQMKD